MNSRLNSAPRQWRVVVALLSAWGIACGQGETRASSEPPSIEIRAVVRPSQAATVTAQVDGKIERILVQEGARVEANGPLVEVSNALVERDAAVTRAQLEWIDARLRRQGRPVRGAGQPSDSLEISRKILELRKQRLDKMKTLRASNDITARELEHAEIDYLAALRDFNGERRAASAGVQSAGDPELLRIERDKTAAEARFAAARLALLDMRSPISGVVTRLHVTPGQAVFPRDPIADIADLATMHVYGEVAPELLRYLRPGVRVDVKILGIPARTFADEIESVIPQGSGPNAGSAAVIVAIPNPDGSIQANTEALITVRSLR